MGDVTTAPGSANEFPATTTRVGYGDGQGLSGYAQPELEPVFSSQLQHQQQCGNQHHQHHQQQHHQQHAFASQYDMTAHTHGPSRGPPGPYDMSSMMHSLPQANFRPGGQRFNAPTGGPQPIPQMSPYIGAAAMNSTQGPQYYMTQHGPLPHFYGAAMPASQQHQHQHQHQHQQDGVSGRANAAYYQQQHVQPQFYYPQSVQFANHGSMVQNPMAPGQYAPSGPQHGDLRLAQQQTGDRGGGVNFYQPPAQVDGGKADSRANVVRGPPRKPKQSGHAIWIGNLPPQTELMSLVYHVCKEAPGLESLFLISKSNCAFANFKDEQACVTAQQKIHDSEFQTVRLVSRLRKSTVEGASGVTAPTGPSASTPQSVTSQDTTGDGPSSTSAVASSGGTPSQEGGVAQPPVASPEPAASSSVAGSVSPPQKDKYFILKSLTVEDLEQSVKTGIWATQSHNEKALNNAFEVAESVFLVFSANKSGEYFGYARMTSQINEDPAAAIEFAPKAQLVTDVGLPKAIPTEANEFMPRGSIMDDSERGTIFWEAEHDDGAEEEEPAAGAEATADYSGSSKSAGGEPGETKAWGKPFHLEWMSTSRLPFYRTKGLRNPWNSNKEIKIARDGTELEPSVGRKLTALFSPRGQGPAAINAVGQGLRQQSPLVAGYPPVRPPYQN